MLSGQSKVSLIFSYSYIGACPELGKVVAEVLGRTPDAHAWALREVTSSFLKLSSSSLKIFSGCHAFWNTSGKNAA